ncbi:hypothetical protein BGX27_007362 [Mortierella sp. AM989]|nr:hypothetical protein BGX27_007362 [Mortierella sp. AM989]
MTITAVIQELALLVEMSILTIVSGDVCDASLGAITSNKLDITELLLLDFPIPPGVSPTMKLSILPAMLQSHIDTNSKKSRTETSDLDLLLSQDFMQALFTFFMGNKGNKDKELRPLWSQIFEAIKTNSSIHDHSIKREELEGFIYNNRSIPRLSSTYFQDQHSTSLLSGQCELFCAIILHRLFNELANDISNNFPQATKRVDEIKKHLSKVSHNALAHELPILDTDDFADLEDIDLSNDLDVELDDFADLGDIDLSSDFGSEAEDTPTLAELERVPVLSLPDIDMQVHQPKTIQDLSSPLYPRCLRSAPQPATLMFIGISGTCVGSRLKGHARRGGHKMRKERGCYLQQPWPTSS